MRRELGDDYEIFEEGLGGRTTVFDRLPSEYRNGKDVLVPVLETHAPLDLVILLLGTNDVSLNHLSVDDIAKGIAELAGIVQRSWECGPAPDTPPEVLIVAPPVVGPLLPEDLPICGGSVERSRELPAAYGAIATGMTCHFLDLAPIVTTSALDGWHWEAPEHEKAGIALAGRVREILT